MAKTVFGRNTPRNAYLAALVFWYVPPATVLTLRTTLTYHLKKEKEFELGTVAC